MRTTPILKTVLLAWGGIIAPVIGARAQLTLQPKYVTGFPIDAIRQLIQVDSRGDGRHRLALRHDAYIAGLEWSPELKTYQQSYFIQGTFTAYGTYPTVVSADGDGDSLDDLLYIQGRSVTVRDPVTGAVLRTYDLSTAVISAIGQDVDGKPGQEVVAADGGLSAYKGSTRLWHAAIAGTPIAGAAPGELLVRTVSDTVVLDAATGVERRRLPIKCSLEVAGFFGSRNSGIACGTDKAVQMYDAVTGALRWSQPSSQPPGVLDVLDADQDGAQDVVVRGQPYDRARTATLVVLDGRTGRPLTPAKNLEEEGEMIAIHSGCESALLVLENGFTNGPDVLTLLDPLTLATRGSWRVDGQGISRVIVADTDRDGRNELLVHHSGKLSALAFQPRSESEATPIDFTYRSDGMLAAQLDNDPDLEVVVGSTNATSGGAAVLAVKAASKKVLWMANVGDGEAVAAIEPADVNGDGQTDILATSQPQSSAAEGSFVYAFNGSSGARLWRSMAIGGLRGKPLLADTDGDGRLEVLALSGTTGIVRLDPATGAVTGFYEFTGGMVMAAANLDHSPGSEVIVAATSRLFILAGGKEIASRARGDEIVTNIVIADVDGDGSPELLTTEFVRGYANPDTTVLRIRSLPSLDALWSSPAFPLLINFGQSEDAIVADVDNDGRDEVVFHWSQTICIYRVGTPAVDVTAPQFGTNAAVSTAVVVTSGCCASVQLHWDDAELDTSPPVHYRVYRSDVQGRGGRIFLGSTQANEFVDASAAAGGNYRYGVEVVDAAGNAASGQLTATVSVPVQMNCHRRAVAR